MWYFWGVIFIISSFVGLIQYGFWNFLVCLIIGIFLIYNGKLKRIDGSRTSQKQAIKSPNSNERDKGFSFPVVGVTFENEDGTDRQQLLRKIYFHDKPFDIEQNIVLERYFWKGSPAYYVKVNGYIIGNIGSDFVWYFEENSMREYCIDSIQVYGGKNKKWGAKIHGTYLDIE